MSDLVIVFPLYPGVTHLDFTGPQQVLCRVPGAKIIVASMGGADIEADGLTFTNLADLAKVEACDVICVPGGFGTSAAMLDEAFMAHIKRLAGGAKYLTSVCTGSLILAAAGLLKGKRAACHWAWRDQLALFGAIPDPARVVRDGRYVTGGGVTAGIDFALTLAVGGFRESGLFFGKRQQRVIDLADQVGPFGHFSTGGFGFEADVS